DHLPALHERDVLLEDDEFFRRKNHLPPVNLKLFEALLKVHAVGVSILRRTALVRPGIEILGFRTPVVRLVHARIEALLIAEHGDAPQSDVRKLLSEFHDRKITAAVVKWVAAPNFHNNWHSPSSMCFRGTLCLRIVGCWQNGPLQKTVWQPP